jgi:hypothetical protein
MASVFISYRRDDTASEVDRLRDWLVPKLGGARLFTDTKSIGVGEDFIEVIDRSISNCRVILAVIGPEWLAILKGHEAGTDFVRTEIETALQQGKKIFPLLVRDAVMPGEADLPDSINQFGRLHAVPMRPDPDFKSDIDQLVRALDNVGIPIIDEPTVHMIGRIVASATSNKLAELPANYDVPLNELFARKIKLAVDDGDAPDGKTVALDALNMLSALTILNFELKEQYNRLIETSPDSTVYTIYHDLFSNG